MGSSATEEESCSSEIEKKYQHLGKDTYSGVQSCYSTPTAPRFLLSGTSPCDEVDSGSASFCILHLCPVMSRFYIWHCNSCLLKRRSNSSLGLLGNQRCSLCKVYCIYTINQDSGFFAFTKKILDPFQRCDLHPLQLFIFMF